MRGTFFLILLVVIGLVAFTLSSASSKPSETIMDQKPTDRPTAVFAGGCFWCTESEYRALNGVLFTRVGYAGGNEPNPTYDMVSSHGTDYAEAIEVTYDPAKITYDQLLEFFLTKAHDPTQKDRQGPDVGHQYRSAIFFVDAAQKTAAENMIKKVTADKVWNKPIVTTLESLTQFWEAEDYHQQYFEKYKKKYGIPHINDVVHGG
jgi:methionine-S-sulfoxide reductase